MNKRLISRNQKIENYEFEKISAKSKNKFYKRQQRILEESLNKNYVLTGNIKDIEIQLKSIKKEKREKERKIDKLETKIIKTYNNYKYYRDSINRLKQINYMQEDIDFYKNYKLNQKIFNKINDKNNNNILKIISYSIPDDIINYIKEFLCFETRCNLLEQKYNPLKIINTLPKFKIQQYIKILIQNINSFNLIINTETLNIISYIHNTFYNCDLTKHNQPKIKRNITDERLFLKNIILSFRPSCIDILFKIYKEIIIYKKVKMNT